MRCALRHLHSDEGWRPSSLPSEAWGAIPGAGRGGGTESVHLGNNKWIQYTESDGPAKCEGSGLRSRRDAGWRKRRTRTRRGRGECEENATTMVQDLGCSELAATERGRGREGESFVRTGV
eukprot:754045-Hanusia_phi.AAC.7